MTADRLPPPADYLPVEERFEFRVGLARLGADFGNGAADGRVFQLDDRWHAYREAKLEARRERLDKYVARSPAFTAGAERAVTAFLLAQLPREYPERFRRTDADGCVELACELSGETLHFDSELRLADARTPRPLAPDYQDGLDALLCQVQEDLAFVAAADDGDRLAYLHLCFPNHWSAQDKVGSDFRAVHGPVPGFERIGRQARRLVDAMTERGPFVRFAWGLATDTRLNHHPQPPPGHDPAQWHGRHFDPADPRLFLRMERQVTVGLPQVPGFLFTIRTYFRDVAELDGASRRKLAAALASMDERTAAYKGVADRRAAVVAWLRAGAGNGVR